MEILAILTVTLTSARYRAYYDGNGNTGGYVPMDKGFYSSTATLTIARNTEKMELSGSKFIGWNTSPTGLGSSLQPRRTVVMGAADRILYAKWNSGPTYSVIYDGNGNDNGSVPFDENNYVQNDTVPVMSNTIYSLSKKGYEFRGWNTQADTMGIRYPAGSQTLVMPAFDIKLSAMWKSLF